MTIEKLRNGDVNFQDVITFIDENYDFSPTKFKNGKTINEENQNNGSCKIFAFAKLNQFSKDETLQLFGDFYRKDVLEHPEADDHQNIRNFMIYGWEGIGFEKEALSKK